jgi:hypothetical protein
MNNKYGFKNSILIVTFNFARNANNKEYIKNLYQDHFKDIIFYSDVTEEQRDDEINYIETQRGCQTHKIFKHFYNKYADLISTSDGVFYTMDDNILNLNILNLYRNDKLIFFYRESKELNKYEDHWHWKRGKKDLLSLQEDFEFKEKFNWKKFSGCISDFFYMPKKHFSEELVEAFDIFTKTGVFLEIAIPSVIHNLIPDKTEYQFFNSCLMWGDDRKNAEDLSYVKNSFNKKHNLIVHPIKFDKTPESKDWLVDIFHKRKCVVITTINPPSEAVLKHISNKEYDTIIVEDNKTPSEQYLNLDCIYLDINSQKLLFPELSELIPYNHYCRKNLGYLYAIQKGYDVIYETDDDNVPNDNFDSSLSLLCDKNRVLVRQTNSQWVNIFKFFSEDGVNIWPRGLPVSQAYRTPEFTIEGTDKHPSIVNGLVGNEPDVDAIHRLTHAHKNVQWNCEQDVVVDNQNICPFNSQNTFWIDKDIFNCLLLPSSVSFRYCDILRGVITNIVLKKLNKNLMFVSPNVVQNRNEHDTFKDLESEVEMYKHNEYIADLIENNTSNLVNINDIVKQIYKNLLKAGIIKQLDLDILDVWLIYLSKK